MYKTAKDLKSRELIEQSINPKNDTLDQNKIKLLINQIENDPNYYAFIKDPRGLIDCLDELDQIVGNYDIKNNICIQIKQLISEIRNGKKNNNMLNTLIYGPPGTGKTSIAIIMAKIWNCLGFLGNKTYDYLNFIDSIGYEKFELYCLGLTLIIQILFKFFSAIFEYLKKFSYKIMIGIGIILVILLYIVISSIITAVKQELNKKDDSLYKIVSREDFVAMYVGQTDKKTIGLLERNLGKVLIIDEAYSLFTDERDCFGAEALCALNRFLSENPGKIFVIMAGYKNLLKKGVFKIQPGLPRRFMWHFDAPGYNSAELFDIFDLKVKKEGWILKKEEIDYMKNMFDKNKDIFKFYGGDIDKLIFFSKLDHTDRNCPPKLLDFFNVKKGMQSLFENNNL